MSEPAPNKIRSPSQPVPTAPMHGRTPVCSPTDAAFVTPRQILLDGVRDEMLLAFRERGLMVQEETEDGFQREVMNLAAVFEQWPLEKMYNVLAPLNETCNKQLQQQQQHQQQHKQ